MKDSDPRPMPAEVLRSYREPIDLLALLQSSAYSDKDSVDVREALLEAMIERHGDAWVSLGFGKQAFVELPFSRRSRQFRGDKIKAIGFMLGVPDYGGLEETLPLLAMAMQPRWSKWWSGFEWKGFSSITAWCRVTKNVLGDRQFAWLAAQFARVVVDLTTRSDRRVCLDAIEAVEAWAIKPSQDNRRVAAYAAREASLYDDSERSDAAYDARAAVTAAAAAAGSDDPSLYVARTFAEAINASAGMKEVSASVTSASFSALTKRLITPTLVTSASR